ncbi:MAG: hypothetical protein JW888_03425 [Pirellulales bacterium]|nr:hypothetical protein [Pirellulales bacterium]
MKFKEVVVLLPVDSLEDLSLDGGSSEAQSLLAAWTVPFHPAIMTSAGRTVEWRYVQDFVDSGETDEALVLLPSPSQQLVPEGWIDEVQSSGGFVLHDFADRDLAVALVLAKLDPPMGGLSSSRLNTDLIADFLALGFCQLQVELLTRQQRYMGSLDKEHFDQCALRAAEATMRGQEEAAREDLQSAFNVLAEAREYFYPAESHMLDLTLVAPSTLGQTLVDELVSDTPTTLLISGQTVSAMAADEPLTLAALKMALAEQRVDVAGGEFVEPTLTLATPESILAEIRRGLAVYEKHLGQRPTIFARRRFGLTPILPQILEHCGFVAACHFTLDGGRFPMSDQSKILWEGAGGASFESLARVPIDASEPRSFLQLPRQLGSALDLDDAPTAVFAHWPGSAGCWLDALRRMNRYSPVLGKFSRLIAYFEETAGVGQAMRYGPDEYRSPYLSESIETGQRDPVSRWVRYHARQATVETIGGLRCMTQVMQQDASQTFVDPSDLRFAVADLANSVSSDSRAEEEQLEKRLRAALDEAIAQLAESLPRRDDEETFGRLCINPCSFARAYETPRKGTDRFTPGVPASINVPAMGFTWASPETAPRETQAETPGPRKGFWSRTRRRSPQPLAEENILRNEFFEATIDSATGAVSAIHDYHTRGNRLAAQLAFRSPELAVESDGAVPEESETAYSRMAAERIEVETANPSEGRITSRGRLVDRHGNRLAGFVQTMRVRRGCRILEIDIELLPERQPGPHPWDSYYAVRFAWDDPTAELSRSVNLTSWPTGASRFEAPHFVEIRGGKRRTTILTGGLPYHRRSGSRKMDSLLVVHGETSRWFRLGIGIDLPHPVSAAVDFLSPRPIHVESAPPPRNESGWLFHVDAANVVASGWEPLIDGGRVAGFRVRLLETEGHATHVHLRSFRPAVKAQQTDFLGNSLRELDVDEDRIAVDLETHGWVQIEAHWDGDKD